MEIIRNHPTLKGKLSQTVSCRYSPPMVPYRLKNYPQTVSCHYAPPLFHAGQETFRNQFPAAMLRQCPMPDRKLFANSFLPPCSTTVPRRMGNYPPTVSFRYESHCSQVGQETFRKQFPAAMLHYCPMPDKKLSANSFLSPCSTNGPKSDRKLSANSFLSLCSTTAPCQTGNYPRTVSCRHAPPLPHAGWETIEKRL